jgi:hypothetical protein
MGHSYFINIGKGEAESEVDPTLIFSYGIDFPAQIANRF